jgi:hypothetical protein
MFDHVVDLFGIDVDDHDVDVFGDHRRFPAGRDAGDFDVRICREHLCDGLGKEHLFFDDEDAQCARGTNHACLKLRSRWGLG